MRRVFPLAVVIVATLSTLASTPLKAADDPPRPPKVWAIVVGIDQYEDALIPACPGAPRDAREVADWFINKAGWGEKHVLRMDNLGRPRPGKVADDLPDLLPTRANLDWAVVEWLGHRVQKHDIVVIYFAGQATSRPPLPTKTAGRSFLLPVDARAADVNLTGWSLDEALDKAQAVAAKQARIVLWLDTSTAGRGERGLALEKGAPSGQEWLRALTRWPGVNAWLAADGRPALDRGAVAGTPGPFVTSLLKALGTREQAHNLLGCLQGLRDNPEITKGGFLAMGGVGPAVSLWSGGLVVEEQVPELIVQAGHGKQVTSVLVTADNTRMITASRDSTVKVWNLADRSLLRVLTEPMVGVEALALDRDGAVLMAGDGLGRIFGWDLAKDRPRAFFGPSEHTEGIVDIAFLDAGKTFVSRDRSRRSILWETRQGVIKKLRVLTDEPLSRLAAATRPEPGSAVLAAAVEPTAGGPGSVLIFDATGKQLARHDGPGGRISALEIASDGRRLAIGDDLGKVRILDLPSGALAFTGSYQGMIRLVKLASSGLLLVSDDQSLRLVEPRKEGSSVALVDSQAAAVGGEVDRSAFSSDGRWLAVCTPEGRALAWRLTDPTRPEAVVLPSADLPALSPAFSADGKTLLVGDSDGGLRAWSLLEAGQAPRAESRPRILPARGQVASLVASPSGRYLLEITKDDLGLIWDLEQGRGCKTVPGTWVAGAFLPDESKLLLVNHPNQGGDLMVVDRATGAKLPVSFARPLGADGRPANVAFGSLSLSKSGKWVAAASFEAQSALASVWSVADGKLVHVARDHDGGLTDVDLSSDEAYLLTASEDGSAKIWPLADADLELRQPEMTFFNPADNSPAITAAKICPGKSGRVVTGTRGGFVFLWDWNQGKRTRTDLGRLDGEVNATVFSPDGRWLAASSARDKSIRFWSIPETGKPVPVDFEPRPHHNEQVGALAAWPNGSMFVSGGDDAAVKFWDLKNHALLGTLVAQGRDDKFVDWLAFTPEGLFDGSLPGEALVKWRLGEKIITLEQSLDTHHVFQLATAFGKAERPKIAELKDDSPQLKIASPPTNQTMPAREVEISIWTGDANPAALRLYQNGVPVKAEGDFDPGDRPNFLKTQVTLRSGENRFYAMASRAGAVDGKTDEVILRYEGPDPPGRVHTLALGVSRYKNRPLKYAHADAERIAEYLDSQGGNGAAAGEQIVLTDEAVTVPAIVDAFRRIREAVKGKPEDTVVLFLAGHTDTDSTRDQFCLLLPNFPFQAAPAADPLLPPSNLSVAMRGNSGTSSFVTRIGEPGVLPYGALYARLAQLEALQRLIIVDACQAGAILDDPLVQNIQRCVETGSRKVRNSYLLAARRGEPANEADALEHGLLTYTLLHGMKAPRLKVIPADLGGFPGRASADLNDDGTITTEELVVYTDETLPKLANMFPQLVIRAGNGPLPANPNGPAPGAPELEQKLKLQSSATSFPLLTLPNPVKR